MKPSSLPEISVESLTAPGGLRSFVEKMREVVFPRATEEARELFRAGQKHGVLSRQARRVDVVVRF